MEMKISQFFSTSALTAAILLTSLTSAQAETITGTVLALTKGSKATVIEIAPEQAGNPPAYRLSVSTTFPEIAELLMQAMQNKNSVVISSSDKCKPTGMLRDCGSVTAVEMIKKRKTRKTTTATGRL